jgi:hypothetical protein
MRAADPARREPASMTAHEDEPNDTPAGLDGSAATILVVDDDRRRAGVPVGST